MGIFFKKKKTSANNPQDINIHRTFQIGALVVIALIIYGLYFSEPVDFNSERQMQLIEEIDEKRQLEAKTEAQRIKEEMKKDPQFNKIQEFVELINNNTNPSQSSVLKAGSGYLIYIPEKILAEDSEKNISVDLKNENFLFKISSQKIKKEETLPEKLEEKSNSGLENQKK